MSGWRWAFAHRSISHLSLAPLCTFRRLTGAAVSAAPRCMAEGSPGGKCSRQGGAGGKWGRFSSPSASGCVSGAVLASGDAVNQASSNSACCLCPARLGMRVLPSLLISGLSHYPVCLPCPSVHPWIPCIQFPCAHFLVTLCLALISWYVRSTPHADRIELASSSAALPCLLALCVPDTDPLFAAGTHCASSARRLGSGAAQPPRVTCSTRSDAAFAWWAPPVLWVSVSRSLFGLVGWAQAPVSTSICGEFCLWASLSSSQLWLCTYLWHCAINVHPPDSESWACVSFSHCFIVSA